MEVWVVMHRERTQIARDRYAIFWRVVIILLVLLAGLNQYTTTFRVSAATALQPGPVEASLGQLASFATNLVEIFFTSQAYFFVLVGPGLFAGTIVAERERGTLEPLLLTGLSPWAIVTGKLLAHWLHLAGLLLATVPVLALAQVWGGVDYRVLLAGYAVQLSGLLSLGAMCLAISAAIPTMPAAFVSVYAVSFLFWVLVGVGSGGRLSYAANPALFWFDQTLRSGLLPLRPSNYLYTQAVCFTLWQLLVAVMALVIATIQLRSISQPSTRPRTSAPRQPAVPTELPPANHSVRADYAAPDETATDSPAASVVSLADDNDPLHWKDQIWLRRRVGWWLTALAVITFGVVGVGLKLTLANFNPTKLADLAQWMMLTYPHLLALGVIWAMCREFQLRTLTTLLLLPGSPAQLLRCKVAVMGQHLRWLFTVFGLLAVNALISAHASDGRLFAGNWLGHLLQLGFCMIYTDLAAKVALWSALTRRRPGWAMAQAALMLAVCWWLPTALAGLAAAFSYTLQDFLNLGLAPYAIVQSLQASDDLPPWDLLGISLAGMAVYWVTGRVLWWECVWRLDRMELSEA